MGKSPMHGIDRKAGRLRLEDSLIFPVINALPRAIVVVDHGGRIAAANDPWRMLAAGEEAAPGADYVAVAEAAFGAGTHMRLARELPAIAAGRQRNADYVFSTGAPPARWFRVQVAPMADFRHPRIAIHYEDVTELRRLGEESHQMDARLAAAEDAERRRIARELHDSTGQYLTAASMDLARLHRRLAQGQKAGDIVQTLTGTLRDAQRDLRSFSYLLHPPALAEAGLSSSLNQFLAGFGDRTGLRISLNIRCATETLSPADQLALFRVVQEALANAHRHARAKCVSVLLRRAGGQVVLEIQDDGIGMAGSRRATPKAVPGVGLLGMRARLQALGGSLEVADTITGGVVLRAVLPDRRD
jgi:signal transduction histidine kinase